MNMKRLKVKDSVNLEDLKNYGFEFILCDDIGYYTAQPYNNQYTTAVYWIDIKTRLIEIETPCEEAYLDSTIYKLAKADILEEVD